MIIRLSPSGPPIENGSGGPLEFGPGARLRLAEAVTTMGGSLAIPSTGDQDNAILSAEGFDVATPNPAFVVQLASPKEGLNYRAKLTLDVRNGTTNIAGEIVIALDTSIDGGTTWTEQTKTGHHIGGTVTDQSAARTMHGWLPLELGSSLGILDATPPPSLTVRARVFNDGDGSSSIQVSSPATFSGVSGLQGCIHLELEECF